MYVKTSCTFEGSLIFLCSSSAYFLCAFCSTVPFSLFLYIIIFSYCCCSCHLFFVSTGSLLKFFSLLFSLRLNLIVLLYVAVSLPPPPSPPPLPQPPSKFNDASSSLPACCE